MSTFILSLSSSLLNGFSSVAEAEKAIDTEIEAMGGEVSKAIQNKQDNISLFKMLAE